MVILVVGATGATGSILVEELLSRGHVVKAIVRSKESISKSLRKHDNLQLITVSILNISLDDMVKIIKDCDAVASCLGHNLTLKGIWGNPRLLVTDAARLICNSIEKCNQLKPKKYVLMNSAGVSNRDLNEQVSFGQKCIISLIRFLLPPHADNEKASDYFRMGVGQNNNYIEWSIVRPDNLTNEGNVTEYELYPSPIRSAIFNPGKTSRINVSHFIADLISHEYIWNKWKGKMPVIYNKES